MKSELWKIYVTIGHPHSNIPIMEKVGTIVDETINQTPIQAAKLVRKMVADNIENHGYVQGTRMRPAELYYEIYMRYDSDFPFAESTNSPHLYIRPVDKSDEELHKFRQILEKEALDKEYKADDKFADSLLVKMWEEAVEEYNPMEELLNELRKETPDEDVINGLACSLFITTGGHVNKAQISEFEAYAPCKIYPVERDSFGWLIGGIKYNDKQYTFG